MQLASGILGFQKVHFRLSHIVDVVDKGIQQVGLMQ